MAYLITEFDGVVLPNLNQTQDLSPGAVDSTLVASVGGMYNYYGTVQRPPLRQTFEVSGSYVGDVNLEVDHAGNFIVDHLGNNISWGSAVNNLRGQVDAILAKRGVYGTATRQRADDGTVEQTKLCRLLSVRYSRSYQDPCIAAQLSCGFETTRVNWRDAVASTVSAALTAGAPQTLYAYNGGDVPLDDAIITITRTSGTISVVTLLGTGIDLSWTGVISSGQTLTIDCGLQTVRIGSTDQYDGFCINAGHTVRGWLPMALGPTGLTATVTGGAATFGISFFNQWA